MRACDWLEECLEAKLFMFDVDDVRGMVEQVIGGSVSSRSGVGG